MVHPCKQLGQLIVDNFFNPLLPCFQRNFSFTIRLLTCSIFRSWRPRFEFSCCCCPAADQRIGRNELVVQMVGGSKALSCGSLEGTAIRYPSVLCTVPNVSNAGPLVSPFPFARSRWWRISAMYPFFFSRPGFLGHPATPAVLGIAMRGKKNGGYIRSLQFTSLSKKWPRY